MRVLVACEYSGIVRDAFAKQGHYAVSCDLLESERPKGIHIKGDVLDVINQGWDLIIAHPPCTHLAVSGARYFAAKKANGLQEESLAFVRKLMDAACPRICVENPISIISSRIRRPDQIIHPYQFGHDASKATCLWLKGLPLLIGTSYVDPRNVDGKKRWANQTDSGQNKIGPSENRWKERSRTYEGIALAMSEQWSNN